MMHFFAKNEEANAWLAEHPLVVGLVAIALGLALVGYGVYALVTGRAPTKRGRDLEGNNGKAARDYQAIDDIVLPVPLKPGTHRVAFGFADDLRRARQHGASPQVTLRLKINNYTPPDDFDVAIRHERRGDDLPGQRQVVDDQNTQLSHRQCLLSGGCDSAAASPADPPEIRPFDRLTAQAQ